MELSQLYQFIAVAECSNITTAANKLYMTQSSLSRTIISMERELGCDLLVRSRKGVSLTPAGELLLQSANKIVAEVSGLFAGGELAPEDMDEMMKAIQDAYWIAKENNKKFAPRKSRK